MTNDKEPRQKSKDTQEGELGGPFDTNAVLRERRQSKASHLEPGEHGGPFDKNAVLRKSATPKAETRLADQLSTDGTRRPDRAPSDAMQEELKKVHGTVKALQEQINELRQQRADSTAPTGVSGPKESLISPDAKEVADKLSAMEITDAAAVVLNKAHQWDKETTTLILQRMRKQLSDIADTQGRDAEQSSLLEAVRTLRARLEEFGGGAPRSESTPESPRDEDDINTPPTDTPRNDGGSEQPSGEPETPEPTHATEGGNNHPPQTPDTPEASSPEPERQPGPFERAGRAMDRSFDQTRERAGNNKGFWEKIIDRYDQLGLGTKLALGTGLALTATLSGGVGTAAYIGLLTMSGVGGVAAGRGMYRSKFEKFKREAVENDDGTFSKKYTEEQARRRAKAQGWTVGIFVGTMKLWLPWFANQLDAGEGVHAGLSSLGLGSSEEAASELAQNVANMPTEGPAGVYAQEAQHMLNAANDASGWEQVAMHEEAYMAYLDGQVAERSVGEAGQLLEEARGLNLEPGQVAFMEDTYIGIQSALERGDFETARTFLDQMGTRIEDVHAFDLRDTALDARLGDTASIPTGAEAAEAPAGGPSTFVPEAPDAAPEASLGEYVGGGELVVESGSAWSDGTWGGMRELFNEGGFLGDAFAGSGLDFQDQESFIHAVHQTLYDNPGFMEFLNPGGGASIDVQGAVFTANVPPGTVMNPAALFSNQEFLATLEETVDSERYATLNDAVGRNFDELFNRIGTAAAQATSS